MGEIYKPDSAFGLLAWKELLIGESVDWTQDTYDPNVKYSKGQSMVLMQYSLECTDSQGYCANSTIHPLGYHGPSYWKNNGTIASVLTCQDDQALVDGNPVELVDSVRSKTGTSSAGTSNTAAGNSILQKNGFKIENGIIIFDDDNLNRIITTSTPASTSGDGWTGNEYLLFENIVRIERVLGEGRWNHLFPYKKSIYTYSEFLKAAAKYPQFCNEKGDSMSLSPDDVCRKQLAVMFAHFAQETGKHDPSDSVVPEWRQALYYIREIGCPGSGKCSNYTQWGNTFFPPTSGQTYYGRGPKQLSWNYNYGRFSRMFLGNKQLLLDQPERVAEEGWLALGSAFWFYMTPQAPKPSIHDVVTGLWKPNQSDAQAGIKVGFGLTTYIVNGGQECGRGSETPNSAYRIEYYEKFLEYFNLVDDISEPKGCGFISSLPYGGAGDINMYWDKDWSVTHVECKLVVYQTGHSNLEPSGYDDCIRHLGGSVESGTTTDSGGTGSSGDSTGTGTSGTGDDSPSGTNETTGTGNDGTNETTEAGGTDNSTDATSQGTVLTGGKVQIENDQSFSILDPNLKKVVDAATPACGVPSIDLDNLSNEPPNVQRLASILTESQFDFLTSMKKDEYTYLGLLKAAKKYPKFCDESGTSLEGLAESEQEERLVESCKREIAAIFAHFSQETGYHDPNNAIPEWRQSFYYIREIGCPGDWKCNNYTAHNHQFYPPVSGQTYYGRGAKQLSWNYNYGQFSKAFLGNKHYLLVNPDRVAKDAWLNLGAAFWFYMTPQPPKPSMHDVIIGKWQPDQNDRNNKTFAGFGTTTNIINGALECGWGYESTASESRGNYFKALLEHFGLTPWSGEVLGCGTSQGFGTGSSSEGNIYFDRDWSASAPTCKLVSWFTEFSLFYPDSYKNCVKWVKGEDHEPGNLWIEFNR